MSRSCDLIVIGSDPGGSVAAHCAAQLGVRSPLLEKEQHLGGGCLRGGCIPGQAVLAAARRPIPGG